MFQAFRGLFIYCVSPLHMGAGTALGLIDNPIQRERHTDHPVIAGSGLKGAVRHHFWSQMHGQDGKLLDQLFGPDGENASDHAGSVSFADAQLVAFPVRSLRRGFVYATSPLALARTARLLKMTGHTTDWQAFEDDECRVADKALAGDLALEVFQYSAAYDEQLASVADWLAQNALPADTAYAFFRDKLRSDLVLLPNEDFGYFVRNATVVEPHVRIDDASGTADDGGLFYTENLPPESLLLTAVMSTVERKRNTQDEPLSAERILGLMLSGDGKTLEGLHGHMIQAGGDATTGRGQVVLTAVGEVQ